MLFVKCKMLFWAERTITIIYVYPKSFDTNR